MNKLAIPQSKYKLDLIRYSFDVPTNVMNYLIKESHRLNTFKINIMRRCFYAYSKEQGALEQFNDLEIEWLKGEKMWEKKIK